MEQDNSANTPFPRWFTSIILKAYERVLGKNDWNGILNLGDLGFLINHPEPSNQENRLYSADLVSIQAAIEQIYGVRGGRGVSLRSGREAFILSTTRSSLLAVLAGFFGKLLPIKNRIRVCLRLVVGKLSPLVGKPILLEEQENYFILTIRQCLECLGRKGAKKPVCYFTTGYLQAMTSWISGGKEIRVNETRCCASGDSVCEFIIPIDPGSV